MHETFTAALDLDDETWMRLKDEVARNRTEELGAQTDPERAALMGISRATLNRWRKGCNLRVGKATRSARRLDLTVDELFEPYNKAA